MISLILFLPLMARAIPEEEKKRGCRELSAKVLAGQRKVAMERCLDFVRNECDRIEYTFRESCLENSHSDNAIKYDISRGDARSCEAALMKRETHRTLCDGLRRECRENRLALADGSVQADCKIFRDEDDKRLCVQVEAEAERITAAAKAEKEQCAALIGPPKKEK